MSSSNDSSKEENKQDANQNIDQVNDQSDEDLAVHDEELPPLDTDEGYSEYMTPDEDESSDEIQQCENCLCWHGGQEHKCEPEHKDRYA
ncbi:hypothetical protein AAE478_009484 [Parahypoxylon ruwenzoriense]